MAKASRVALETTRWAHLLAASDVLRMYKKTRWLRDFCVFRSALFCNGHPASVVVKKAVTYYQYFQLFCSFELRTRSSRGPARESRPRHIRDKVRLQEAVARCQWRMISLGHVGPKPRCFLISLWSEDDNFERARNNRRPFSRRYGRN